MTRRITKAAQLIAKCGKGCRHPRPCGPGCDPLAHGFLKAVGTRARNVWNYPLKLPKWVYHVAINNEFTIDRRISAHTRSGRTILRPKIGPDFGGSAGRSGGRSGERRWRQHCHRDSGPAISGKISNMTEAAGFMKMTWWMPALWMTSISLFLANTKQPSGMTAPTRRDCCWPGVCPE